MTSTTFGKILREQREQRGISLRKFAKRLEISAAFLVDLEKGRRNPNAQLVQRIADELDMPVSTFESFSPSLPKAVADWAEQEPVFGKALKLLAGFANPKEALAILERGASPEPPNRFPIAIYESELQAIGQESSSWDTETGGDLFGMWGEIPVVYLATKSGPRSVRDQAHFRLDVEYLIKLSIQLERDWGLRYFGDWHSHHRLGLQTPSSGDRARIQRLAEKNGFREMAEFIVTFARSYDSDQAIRVHPYAYLHLPSDRTTDVVPIVLSGVSPVRDALANEGGLPEQQFSNYASYPLERVVVPHEPLPRVPGDVGPVAEPITSRVLKRGIAELEASAAGPVEIHDTPFGHIVVAPVTDDLHVALAVDGKWPHAVLQADWMDRRAGTSEELNVDLASVSLANAPELARLYRKARKLKGLAQ